MGIVIDGDRRRRWAEAVVVNIDTGCKEKRTNLLIGPLAVGDSACGAIVVKRRWVEGGHGHRYRQ